MNYLLLVVGPYGNAQEVWIPHWFVASRKDDALVKAKEMAFSVFEIYQAAGIELESVRFELFAPNSILPTVHGPVWLEEFCLKQRTDDQHE